MKRAKQFKCQLTARNANDALLRQSELIYVAAPDRDTAVYWLHVNKVPAFWQENEDLSITAVQVPDEVAMRALGADIAPPLLLAMPDGTNLNGV